jgi:hypothetical protein
VNAAADLALAYLSQRKYAASEPLASEALTFDRKNQPDDWQRSAPRHCWVPVWRDRRNTQKANRCW